MKNVYLILTDKPSRLVSSRFSLSLKEIPISGFENFKTHHIYITSDEEIKDGEWALLNGRIIVKYFNPPHKTKSYRKIILTTDLDLIKDGVQAIDDEFLEWFVKNTTCEFVKVSTTMLCENCGEENCDNLRCRGYKNSPFYEIIIPKQEQKQILSEMMQENEKSELYEETLEEIAEKYANEWEEIHPTLDSEDMTPIAVSKIDFIEGAKWQQKQMYSEEEAIKKIIDYVDFQFNTNGELNNEIKKWFEQFKKK